MTHVPEVCRLDICNCHRPGHLVSYQLVAGLLDFPVLQRRAARIIYYKAASNLSTDQIMIKLGLEPLYYRRRAHILRFVDECIANRVPRYLF